MYAIRSYYGPVADLPVPVDAPAREDAVLEAARVRDARAHLGARRAPSSAVISAVHGADRGHAAANGLTEPNAG